MTTDTFNTIIKPSKPILYKDRNSKFYAYAFPFDSEKKLKSILTKLKSEHQNAGHFCFAFQIGNETKVYKVNDDGEPNNSAGMPIYGQIQSLDLTNVLVIVVRIFGGVKLGVSGLINAYRSAAAMALEESEIVQKTIDISFKLTFDYKNMSKVMYILKKNNVEIKKQSLTEKCVLEISVRKGNSQRIFERFDHFYGVQIDEL